MSSYIKPITPKEYETYVNVLRKNLTNINSIQTILFTGSYVDKLNADKLLGNKDVFDIDIIGITKPNKLVKGINELNEIIYRVNKELKTDHGIITSESCRMIRQMQNSWRIKKTTGKDPLRVHKMIYGDLASIDKYNPPDFFRLISKQIMYGSLDNIAQTSSLAPKKEGLIFLIEELDLDMNFTDFKAGYEPTIMEFEQLIKYLKKHSDLDIANVSKIRPKEAQKLIQELRLELGKSA